MKRQQEVNLVCSFDISENTKTESFYEKRVVLFFFFFVWLFLFYFFCFFFFLLYNMTTNTHQSTHNCFGISHGNASVRSALGRAGRGVGDLAATAGVCRSSSQIPKARPDLTRSCGLLLASSSVARV